jgi:hypothetical protein
MISTGMVIPPWRRLVLPAATTAFAVLGLALIILGTGPVERTTVSPSPTSPGVGVPAPTGYGWVTVTHVERLRGLTARELGGMTHGVQNLVDSGKVLVAVGVTLTNAQTSPLSYGPSMFRVRIGGPGGATVPAVASQVGPGTLQPDAGIELVLNFVVPSGGNRLAMLAADGRGGQVAIPIGTSVRSLPGGGTHQH